MVCRSGLKPDASGRCIGKKEDRWLLLLLLLRFFVCGLVFWVFLGVCVYGYYFIFVPLIAPFFDIQSLPSGTIASHMAIWVYSDITFSQSVSSWCSASVTVHIHIPVSVCNLYMCVCLVTIHTTLVLWINL